jgi:hypothetical protein
VRACVRASQPGAEEVPRGTMGSAVT